MRRHRITIEAIEASLKRLNSRLRRTFNAIGKLEQQKYRLERQKHTLVVKKPLPTFKTLEHPLDIPKELLRNDADEKAKAEILAKQEEKRAAKNKRDRERRAAKKSGEANKIPLEGKAALDYIKNGK